MKDRIHYRGVQALLKYSENSICSQLFKRHNVPDTIATHAAKVLLVVRAQTDQRHRGEQLQ